MLDKLDFFSIAKKTERTNDREPFLRRTRSPIRLCRRVSALSIDRYYYRAHFPELLPLSLRRFPQEENWVVSGKAKASSLSRKSPKDYVTAGSFTRREPFREKRFPSVIFNNFDLSPGFYGDSWIFSACRDNSPSLRFHRVSGTSSRSREHWGKFGNVAVTESSRPNKIYVLRSGLPDTIADFIAASLCFDRNTIYDRSLSLSTLS